MTVDIVGRAEELSLLRAFIEEPRPGPGVVLLEGEAGIGKSALWLAAVEEARRQGFRVLAARPAEAEQVLAHAGLGDLLEDALADALPVLSAPRRRALEVTLLLGDAPRGDAADPRAVGIATRSALEAVAGAPLLIAVDDVQWLDPWSAGALTFALRRMDGVRVVVLAARRRDRAAPPAAAGRVLGIDDVHRIDVGPLSPGALHLLLRDRLGRPFGRLTLLRIHERSGGNPFFALELARHVDPHADPSGPVAIPATLEELLRARLAGLPAATRRRLAVVSALGAASPALLAAAGVAKDELRPALAAGVLELDDGTIRFGHPLLASAVYADLGDERRAVHAKLAEVVSDPLQCARHLALSRESPDAAVAADLEAAADVAAQRGAWAVAAELAEHALRFTPAETATTRRERALRVARAHHAAGEWTRARAVTGRLLAGGDLGSLRADVLVLAAELETVDRAVLLLDQARRAAADRPALRSLIHCRLAWATRFRDGYARAARHARAAELLAADDRALRAQAQLVGGILGWMVGDGQAPGLGQQSRDLAAALGGDRFVQEAMQVLVNTAAPAASRDRARTLLETEYAEWRGRDEPRAARALWGLSWIAYWAGAWEQAAVHADAAHETAIQYGLEVPQDHLPIALVALRRGRIGLAREHSARALELAREQFGLEPPQHLSILGIAAHWDGDDAAALSFLDRASEQAAALDWGEPTIRWWTDDHVELLLEHDRAEEAMRLLDRWEADAARRDREWVRAHATRCRGLAALTRGQVEPAEQLLLRAVAEHQAVGDPFGAARAQLALGVARRRMRQKRTARDAIEASIGGFARLGAAGWEGRARAELGRVGGRQPEIGLSAAERRVAALVAEGRTNREVSAALFVAERTVASHLTHIYAKLGVRSRTELARRMR